MGQSSFPLQMSYPLCPVLFKPCLCQAPCWALGSSRTRPTDPRTGGLASELATQPLPSCCLHSVNPQGPLPAVSFPLAYTAAHMLAYLMSPGVSELTHRQGLPALQWLDHGLLPACGQADGQCLEGGGGITHPCSGAGTVLVRGGQCQAPVLSSLLLLLLLSLLLPLPLPLVLSPSPFFPSCLPVTCLRPLALSSPSHVGLTCISDLLPPARAHWDPAVSRASQAVEPCGSGGRSTPVRAKSTARTAVSSSRV